MSSDAIYVAHADFQAFYVQTYHLKDSSKNASATTGISPHPSTIRKLAKAFSVQPKELVKAGGAAAS
jgi:hypothetical protein